jgi:uncharacterized delta-60 repeat protein
VRYNPDGSLDLSFDGDGRVTTNFSGENARANALVLLPDGKIIAAGYIYDLNPLSYADFALARYNPDGSLDASFGEDGKVVTDFFGFDDQVNALPAARCSARRRWGQRRQPTLGVKPGWQPGRQLDGDGMQPLTLFVLRTSPMPWPLVPDGKIVVPER